MFVARLPQAVDADLRERLWEQFRIETPVFRFHDQPMIRISVQAYNSPQDINRLLAALESVIRA